MRCTYPLQQGGQTPPSTHGKTHPRARHAQGLGSHTTHRDAAEVSNRASLALAPHFVPVLCLFER